MGITAWSHRWLVIFPITGTPKTPKSEPAHWAVGAPTMGGFRSPNGAGVLTVESLRYDPQLGIQGAGIALQGLNGSGPKFPNYENELPFRNASITSPRCPDASVSSSKHLRFVVLFGSLTTAQNL